MCIRDRCGLSFPMQAIMKVYNWLDKLASEAVSYTHLDVYKRQDCERQETGAQTDAPKRPSFLESLFPARCSEGCRL